MLTKKQLIKLFKSLPGEKAHVEFSPMRGSSREAIRSGSPFRLSAVAIVLYLNLEGELCVVVIERQDYSGKHSGQISFPGGKFEDEDQTTLITAIRECEEEIGLTLLPEQHIGDLTDVYIPVSEFLIKAHVFFHDETSLEFHPSIREVKNVIPLVLSELFKPENRIERDVKVDDLVILPNVKHFRQNETFVWGATALILNELRYVLHGL